LQAVLGDQAEIGDAELHCLFKILSGQYDEQNVPSALAFFNSAALRGRLRESGEHMMAQILEVLSDAFAAMDTHGFPRAERMRRLDLAYIMLRHIIGDGMHDVRVDQADRTRTVMGLSIDVVATLMQNIDVIHALLESHPDMARFLRDTAVTSDTIESVFSILQRLAHGKPTKTGMIRHVEKMEFIRKLRSQRGLGICVRDGAKARYMHNTTGSGHKCLRWNANTKERLPPLFEQTPEMVAYERKILVRAMNSTGTGSSYHGLRPKFYKRV
jgi:hypothetical protein